MPIAENMGGLIERLLDYAREASKELTHHAGGGSEMFLKIGDEYYADPKLCRERIWHRQETKQRLHDEALSQLTREVDDILDEADFLCARLRELENELSDDHTARQFYGHVAPSLARMEALSRSSGGAQ